MNACARCESFYRAQSEVHQRLSATVDSNSTPSPFLKSRILNEIADEEGTPVSSSRWEWIGAGAFALLALTLALGIVDFGPKPTRTQLVKERLAPEWIEMTAEVTSGSSLFRAATNLNQPLQHEMDLVIRDARAALSSLKNDFVPSLLLASKN